MQLRKPLVVVLVAGAAAAGLLCREARGQLARRGGEFQINSSPVGGGQVAALPGGGFIVVWDSDGADGDGLGVLGRRFDAGAQPIGTDFIVNETTIGHQGGPRVATARDGSFFVLWNAGVGRSFSAEAEPVGPEIAIADLQHPFGHPATSVAATEERQFVVAFSDFADYSIRARRFGADGQPAGPSFLVDSAYHDTSGAAAGGPGDSSLIVWLHDEWLIEGRLFDGDQPRGPKFPVADVNSAFVQGPQICGHETGGFVVTWATYDGDSSDRTVLYRRYDSAGDAASGVLRTTPPRRGQAAHSPAVACGPQPGGDFVLAWAEAFSDCQAFNLRLYSICGRSVIGDQVATFRVGAPESTFARAPSLAVTGDSDFVLTWLECTEHDGCDMFGQRFTRSAPVDCPGDCDRNGVVTIDEVLAAVKIALSDAPELMKQCLPADVDLDYRVSIGELVAALNRLLEGC